MGWIKGEYWKGVCDMERTVKGEKVKALLEGWNVCFICKEASEDVSVAGMCSGCWGKLRCLMNSAAEEAEGITCER